MNKPMSWFNYEIPEWFNVENYKLLIVNKNGKNSEINLKALDMSEFVKFNPPPPGTKNQLNITADYSSAVLTYPRLDYPNDSIRNRFLNDTFLELKNKRINNLIIDLRGNGGGTPLNAAYFLLYLMVKDFVYSNTSTISEYLGLTNITMVDDNRYKGKMYFLIDGGSFSSTGHILSFVRNYKLGPLIGELSSGSYSCNTIGFPFPLPNSKLVLKCSTGVYETSVKGQNRAKGIVPDYEVRNSLTDILTGQDKVLEFARTLTTERK
ncbi:MAG: S41 family peptidase [Opitutaceae bacterium]|nr:S41 family peptidase [Cytophagales bacterium]